MNEIWRDIPGYEGIYQVSSTGIVRSLPRYETDRNGKQYQRKGIILQPTLTTTGYYKVKLVKNGKRKDMKIHRLVAMAFLVNTYNKPHINHKDGNPLNNVVDNLEWCTQSENAQHAHDTGLFATEQNIVDHNEVIKEYLLTKSASGVCEKFDISKTVLYGILNKHKIRRQTKSEQNDKYNLNLSIVLEDMRMGLKNGEIASKHHCPKGLIATRRCQFRKEGKL